MYINDATYNLLPMFTQINMGRLERELTTNYCALCDQYSSLLSLEEIKCSVLLTWKRMKLSFLIIRSETDFNPSFLACLPNSYLN